MPEPHSTPISSTTLSAAAPWTARRSLGRSVESVNSRPEVVLSAARRPSPTCGAAIRPRLRAVVDPACPSGVRFVCRTRTSAHLTAVAIDSAPPEPDDGSPPIPPAIRHPGTWRRLLGTAYRPTNCGFTAASRDGARRDPGKDYERSVIGRMECAGGEDRAPTDV